MTALAAGARRSVRSFLVLAGVALAGAPGKALAQGNSADAEELFKQGRAALDANDYATACPKFAASLQIERAVGTLMSLAKCEEASNKLASARQHWQEAADFADASNDRLARGPACRVKFAELDRRVPRLTVRLAQGAPSDTVVKRDGAFILAATLGSPWPVDPGPHTLETSAAGRDTTTLQVELKEGEAKEAIAAPGPETAVGLVAPPPAVSTSPHAASRASGGMGGLFWTGVAVTGTGVAAGLIFGGLALSKSGSLSGECPNHTCTPGNSGQSDLSSATSMAVVSDVFFAVAGVGAVIGVVGYIRRPHKAEEKPGPGVALWLGPASAGLKGTFE